MEVQPDELVVGTPERVSFSYAPAGLGSRFVAQFIDLLLLFVVLAMVSIAAAVAGAAAGTVNGYGGELVVILWLAAVFVLLLGYFAILEGAWSGRTLGKAAMRLRVVDQRGGPISVSQSVIRNLVRFVDFLPVWYALGAVVIFANRRNQRLGDLAAGTLVVQEQRAVTFAQLVTVGPQVGQPPTGPSGHLLQPRGGRNLEPALKRFVSAYAQRRSTLHPEQRAQLAGRAEPALRAVLPQIVVGQGPLAALERLADEEQAGW